MSTKIEQGLKTRNELIEYAQRIFAKNGFSGTRFDKIAKDKGLTTGALYHHFKNKHELFKSVFEKCSLDVANKVSKKADESKDIMEGIFQGCMTYIQTTIGTKYKKIMLEDAISVLGWKLWKDIDDRTSEKSLYGAITEAQRQGLIDKKISPKALARFISGGTNELALWVAETSKENKNIILEVEITLRKIIDSLTKDAAL